MNAGEKSLETLLALPPQTYALLDWCSGIVRINATRQEFERLREKTANPSSLTEDEATLMEALTHECSHYFQICTMGFLYQFAVELLEEVVALLPPDAATGLEALQKLSEQSLNRTNSRVSDLLQKIDALGPDGITVRAIAESHAYFSQKTHHYSNLSHTSYKEMLENAPSIEYRLAYDIADAVLGDKAFDVFPVLASLALSTTAPQESFARFCRAAVNEAAPKTIGDTADLMQRLMVSVRVGFYGSAELLVKKWHKKHLIYTPAVSRLHRLPPTDFNLFAYFAAPGSLSVRLVSEASPLVIFNPPHDSPYSLPIFVPSGVWPITDKNSSTIGAEMIAMLWIAGTRVLSII